MAPTSGFKSAGPVVTLSPATRPLLLQAADPLFPIDPILGRFMRTGMSDEIIVTL